MSEMELKVIKKVGEWLGKLPLKARLRVLRLLLESTEDEKADLVPSPLDDGVQKALPHVESVDMATA